jgi:hypothetical protein
MFKPYKLLMLLAIVCFSMANSCSLLAATHDYQITIDEKIAVAKVNICFEGKAPDFLTLDSKYANRDLIKLPDSNQGQVEIQGRYWKTKTLPANACLNYQVSLERHHAKRSKASKNRRNIAYIESNSWLWLPKTQARHDDIKLSFKIPRWASISAPWYQINASNYEFMMGHQPQDWGYTFLVGDFEQKLHRIVDEHYLNIATIRNQSNKQQITQWLIDSAKALDNYLGDYPVAQTQVIVIEKDKKKHGPVPWGDFKRGNGYGIRFVIVPSYDISDFYADWTATHEFSHQLLPKLDYDDIWLSEGLSSYLQYVLMGREGQLEKDQAWSRIYQGLKRGEKGTKKVAKEVLKNTVEKRSRGGRAERTMRIYWSGAAYFLNAELQLRKHSKGKVGLNDILFKLNRCCIPENKQWSGVELAAKLDELANSQFFLSSYHQLANSTEFPEYVNTLQELGVVIQTEDNKTSKVLIKASSFALDIMRKH